MENSPGRGQKITDQTARYDDEALEPHAGVHTHTYEKHDKDVATAPAEPEKLRRQHVAEEHPQPPIPPIRPEDAVPECKTLVRIAAVPRDKEFHRVCVANERAGQQNDLGHFVDVLWRYHII